jgi:hypothetical protein
MGEFAGGNTTDYYALECDFYQSLTPNPKAETSLFETSLF